jgi:hypothetical protein
MTSRVALPSTRSQAEAQKRLAQHGPNEIEEKKTNELLRFLSYFWGPIPWMIEVAVNGTRDRLESSAWGMRTSIGVDVRGDGARFAARPIVSISARPRNWCRRPTPSATSNAQC